jgi:MYXO-CTERM domain-containing protein
MNMQAAAVVVAAVAGGALAQATDTATIWIEGPDEVLPDSTYTLEVWGRWESPSFVDGVSAFAGFGIDMHVTEGREDISSVGGVQIAGWAAGFGNNGIIEVVDILGASGGQLANLFGILNPTIEMGNPLLLYSFEFTTETGPLTVLEFSPANPNPNGGLSFYPVSTDGASVIAPNDAGTELVLVPWRYEVPGPGGAAVVLAAAGVIGTRRRRR